MREADLAILVEADFFAVLLQPAINTSAHEVHQEAFKQRVILTSDYPLLAP